MSSNLQLILVDGDKATDVSALVSTVKWAGRKGAAPRSLVITFIDDDGYGHDRPEINVEAGHQCIFYWQGEKLFQGLFMSQSQSQKKTMTAKAYDNGIYLANNKDTFSYENATASEIFVDVCKRFGIPYGDVAETSYRIPDLPKPKTTGWDVIADALSLTYQSTGMRYYPLCIGDEIHLIKRRENVYQWVIETGGNVESYALDKSIENTKTRIKLYSKEGEVLAEEINAALEKQIGVFQDVDTADDEMNEGQLTKLVKTTLAEKSQPEVSLSVDAMGLADVYTGVGVFVRIEELDISKTYYVEEDTHTFQGDYHSMRVKLVEATDTDLEEETQAASAEINVGDIVQFAGGSHYTSSTAGSPVGGTRTPGPAKVTYTAKGAAHPYHVVGGAYEDVDGSSNVYGWVDASTVSK